MDKNIKKTISAEEKRYWQMLRLYIEDDIAPILTNKEDRSSITLFVNTFSATLIPLLETFRISLKKTTNLSLKTTKEQHMPTNITSFKLTNTIAEIKSIKIKQKISYSPDKSYPKKDDPKWTNWLIPVFGFIEYAFLNLKIEQEEKNKKEKEKTTTQNPEI